MDKLVIVADELKSLGFQDCKSWVSELLVEALSTTVPIEKLAVNFPLLPIDQQQPKILFLIELYVLNSLAAAEALAEVLARYEQDVKFSVYRVAEREDFGFERSWLLGEPSPSMKMVSLITRKQGMSVSEFDNYWSRQHRQKALSYDIPLWRYQQDTIVSCVGDSRQFDGVSLLHFKRSTDFRDRWLKTPLQAISGAWDATRFMNFSQSITEKMIEVIYRD